MTLNGVITVILCVISPNLGCSRTNYVTVVEARFTLSATICMPRKLVFGNRYDL